MAYDYATERAKIFTEAGVELLRHMQANSERALAAAGAVRMDRLMQHVAGDTWTMLACADYLVEKGVLREVTGSNVPGQYRVFVSGGAQ